MRIAVDAKWYHRGTPGGRSHVRGMLNALAEIDHEDKYRVFVHPDDPPRLDFPLSPLWSVTPLKPNFSLLRSRRLAQVASDCRVIWTQSHLPPRRPGITRAVTVHDLLWHDFPGHFSRSERVFFRFIDHAIRRADVIFTVSEYCRERIQALLGREKHDIVVTPNGVDGQRFAPLAEEAREPLRCRLDLPEQFILYVGRINRRKNLPTLLRALARLPEPCSLVCAGTPDWKQDNLNRLLTELGIGDRVKFLGHVPDADLPGLYSLATVFAYIPFAEGFGIPPLEAMACGTPVVASNTTSVPEVVGDAGLLVPPAEVNAVAEALGALLADPAQRRDLAERGRRRAAQFHWRASAEKVLAVWRSLT